MNALRSYYLAIYLGLGALLPLLALAMQARGLRPSQYAWLMALLPLSRVLAPPVWGALADKWLGTSRLLQLNTVLTALAMAALSQRMSFALTLVAFACWAVFSSSLVPLAEAGTYRLLGENAAHFGYVRVFGSIGFAVSAAAFGVLGADAALSAPFVVAALAYAAASIAAHRLRDLSGRARGGLRHTLGGLAKRPDMLLLWSASTLYYAAHGAFDMYFGPHVRRIPGISARTVSATWALGVVAEVLIFLVVPRWLRARSRGRGLIVAALIASLRWFLLARASTPVHVWLQAPFHAVTFGVWYLVFVHENQADTSGEVRATVQGLAAACLGLGSISATLIGGYILERHGGRALFEIASYLALAAAALYGVRARWLSRADKRLAGPVSEP